MPHASSCSSQSIENGARKCEKQPQTKHGDSCPTCIRVFFTKAFLTSTACRTSAPRCTALTASTGNALSTPYTKHVLAGVNALYVAYVNIPIHEPYMTVPTCSLSRQQIYRASLISVPFHPLQRFKPNQSPTSYCNVFGPGRAIHL